MLADDLVHPIKGIGGSDQNVGRYTLYNGHSVIRLSFIFLIGIIVIVLFTS